jgi:predicted nucleic acid-binding protein
MSSKKIFIDSSALYAFVDRADPNHTQSGKIIEQLSLQNMHLYTSIQSITDTYTALDRQLGGTLSLEFLQATIESTMEILYPQKADLVSAYKLVKLNKNKQVPLKEALNAVLMQKKSIGLVLTFRYWQNLLGSASYLTKF